MSILQKYIFREWFWTTLAVSIVLIIVLLGAYLGNMINDIADGRMPAGFVSMQVLLHLPSILSSILPLGGFIAVMWSLGRMYRDQEMAVMRSSGFGWRKLLRPLLNLVLPLSAVLLLLGLSVVPAASKLAEQQLEHAFRSSSLWGLEAGKFHVLHNGNLVIYAAGIETDGATLKDVFIKQREQGREQVWIAKTGNYWVDSTTGERFLILQHGKVTDMRRGQLDLRVLSFERNDLLLPQPEFRRSNNEIISRSSSDLFAATDVKSRAEFQWRLSPAISAIILGFLAIPLSHSAPNEGRGVRIILGILVYALYGNILFLCRIWVAEGVVPADLGMWWVHVVFLITGLVWIRRQRRFRARGHGS